MRRQTVLTLVALGLLAHSSGVSAKAVTIKYWGIFSGVAGKAEEEVIAKFNKLNQGRIVVKGSNVGDTEQKVLTAIAGGAGPDVFKLDRPFVGSWAARDLLICLDPVLKKDKFDLNQFYRPTWKETIYGGRCYALPWNTDSRALYFNKTLFQQVGLDPANPPKTWEELSLCSKKFDALDSTGKLVRAGFVPVNGNWQFNGWLYSAGGNITTPDGKKLIWDSPIGVKAIHYVNDMLQKYGGFARIGGAGDFWGGKCAMELNTSSWIGEWKVLKTKKFELAVTPPPRPTGLEQVPRSWAGGFAICLPRGLKHQKEAWEFMKYYCANKDAQLTYCMPTGVIPVLNAAARDSRFQEMDPLFEVFTDILPDAEFKVAIPCGQEMFALYGFGPGGIWDLLKAGKKSPEEVLTFTQTQAQKVMDRAWARVRQALG